MLDRIALDAAFSVLRGEAPGDRVKAVRTVTAAGFDPVRISSSAERVEIAARMGRDARPKGIHWDPDHPNDLVFPLMTKEEARAHLATRGINLGEGFAQDRDAARKRLGFAGR